MTNSDRIHIQCQSDRINRNVDEAVELMKECVHRCNRRDFKTEADLVGYVMHELAWAYANAQSRLQSAVNALGDVIVTHELAAKDEK